MADEDVASLWHWNQRATDMSEELGALRKAHQDLLMDSRQQQFDLRKEMNDKITAAFETRTKLGIDTSPHNSAKDIHALPFRLKAKWLENSNAKTAARVEHDKKRTLAACAFKEGRTRKWNADADKTKQKQKENKDHQRN